MHRRAAALLVIALSSACVSHPVGPARTYGKYEGKARTTASSALSEVETARLVAQTAARGSAFGPYTAGVLSDAEEALGGLSGTFGSIQPPDDDADQLRSDLGDLLTNAQDHVAKVRIAARRGRLHDLGRVAAQLDDDIAQLRTFLAEHGA